MTTTYLSDAEYIKSGGNTCPNCRRKGTLEGGNVEVSGTEAYQTVICIDCGAKFEDVFKLIGYADLDLSEAIE
jgi:hypothetical protein